MKILRDASELTGIVEDAPDANQSSATPSDALAPFFGRLAEARRRVLMLDYDGTLAPFVVERDRALPYPGVREILNEILRAGGCEVWLISGRSIADLLPLIDLDSTPGVWGAHGWESLRPGASRQTSDRAGPADAASQIECVKLPTGAAEALAQAVSWARPWAASQGLSERLEIKHGCVALHWRGMADKDIDRIRTEVTDAWTPIENQAALQLRGFDGGLELRVPGRDKGSAVESILGPTQSAEGIGGSARPDSDSRTVAAYLGDDLTDEDAFAAMRGRGLRALVRPECRETAADVWLRPPAELLEFLDAWHTACR